MTGPAPIAFWLLPAKQDAGWLEARVRELSSAHAGPVFEPHVTLHVGTRPSGLAIEPLLAALARQAASLELVCLDAGHSDAYYKALFLRLGDHPAPGPGIGALRARLLEALTAGGAADSGYVLEPHLSLLYGTFDAALRQQLALAQSFHGRRIRFDRIAAVRPAPGSIDLAWVSDWEVFGHAHLAADVGADLAAG